MKKIKIVRETEPKNDTKAQPEAFHIRHDRFLTLLGTFIVFATFIAKEAIRDNLRDLLNNIETAENVYILRQDNVYRFDFDDSDQPNRHDEGSDAIMEQHLIHWEFQAQRSLDVSMELAKALPTSKRKAFLERQSAITLPLLTVSAPRTSDPKLQERAGLKAMEDAYKKYAGDADSLNHDIFEEADQLKEKRELHYRIAQWISYALFALGWLLAFYGQLSGRPAGATKLGE